MPTPPSPRVRFALTALGALGLIGAGSAAIIAGAPSGDREIRLAATSPADAATGAAEGTDVTEDLIDDEASASPSASDGTSASASPSTSASARPSTSASKRPKASPSASRKVSGQGIPGTSAKPSPSRTTQAPSTGGGDSSGSSSTITAVITLVNQERAKAGCSGLTSESRLEAAAQKHSELQADRNEMSHQLAGEASMGDRVTAEGYRWRSVAENVAAGYPDAASVMDGWMNSPGHKANILNCGYQEIGVGLAKSSSGTPYWTQNFASPA